MIDYEYKQRNTDRMWIYGENIDREKRERKYCLNDNIKRGILVECEFIERNYW